MNRYQIEITTLHAKALVNRGVHESNASMEATRSRLAEIIREIKQLSSRRIFQEIDKLIKILTETESGLDSRTNIKLNSLKVELEAFGGVYEKFITAQQLGEAAELLAIAQRVDVVIHSSIMFAAVVLKNLCSEAGTERTDDQLEIYLSSETDFLLFLQKINALEQIYEEFCHLFNVSAKQEPLKIVKIESGTAWAWLKGSIVVITAMRSVIEKAAHYLYRNYTDEGKLSTIPKKVETIESVLHLSDELKKRAIPTDQLDEHLKKASVLIGNQLEKLLGGEEEIELNGVVIALTPNSQQKQIAKQQVKLIGDNSAQ